jgi:1-acyl-sn-glycerol-3-phosphate acyltransferase
MKNVEAKEQRNFNRRYAYEYNIIRTSFYMFFLYTVVFQFFNIFYNYKIEGRENLPKDKAKGRYIYAANHVCIFDPTLVVMAALTPIAFMAKKELFEPTEKLSWLVKRLGAFAVDREKPEIATFKTVKDIFTTKWALAVFPQGGTRPYGKLEGIKRGFGVIAKTAKADIIPVAIGNFSGYPKLIPFKRQTVDLHICEPISYELPTDEIIYRWCEEISNHANYTHDCPKPDTVKDNAQVANPTAV